MGIIAAALTGWWLQILIPVALLITGVAVWDKCSHAGTDTRKLIYANLNSFIVMLLGGLWHGASWNFIIWGGLNGIAMIVNKFWRIMNWHVRMAAMLLLTAGVYVADLVWNLPVWHLFRVWTLILCAGTAIRYIYFLITKLSNLQTSSNLFKPLGVAWAVAQTFTFITFTRLFFRSSSNLDPATANQVAWGRKREFKMQMRL